MQTISDSFLGVGLACEVVAVMEVLNDDRVSAPILAAVALLCFIAALAAHIRELS